MARLPEFTALGDRREAPSGRVIASADLTGEAKGIESLGTSIYKTGQNIANFSDAKDKEATTLGAARADADFLTKRIDFEKQFNEQDQDYANWSKRYEEGMRKIHSEAAAQIPDEQKRELWSVKRQSDLASGLAQIQLKAKARGDNAYIADTNTKLDEIRNKALE